LETASNRIWTALNSRTAIGLLILVAALIRLSLICTSRFTGDEAIFYQAAVHIRDGIAFPELGPAVTGGVARHPGPLFYYLMSLSQFFSRTPEAANAETAILGALSIGFLWDAVRRVLGTFPAFLAALLMTFSPWAILYADRIWNANVIIFLVAVAFWAAVRVYQKPGSRWIAMVIALSAIMPQFHLSVPVVWLALIALMLPNWRRLRELNWGFVALGVAIAVLGYAPYLHSELQSGFANLKALRAENLHLEGRRQFYKVPIYAFRFFTLDTTYHELMGYWGGLHELSALKAAFVGSPVRPFSVFRLIALVASIVLAVMIYLSAFRERRFLGLFWRAFWIGICTNILLLAITPKAFYPHYLTPMLPFFFAISAGLAHQLEWDHRLRKWLVPVLCIFCIGGVEASVSISRNLDQRNGLKTQRQVIRWILEDAAREGWQPSARIGLHLDFPGYLEGYSVLLEESYRSRLQVSDRAEGAPQYVLAVKPPTRSAGDYREAHVLEDAGLIFYRVDDVRSEGKHE
jgi:4-amino-4-deoxy-L-arabinose transferase-like glycosyltransferase